MKVTSFSVARPAYWDRNAVETSNSYIPADLAPHLETTRFSYTVAANRKTFLDTAFVQIVRTSAYSSVGEARVMLYVLPSGGSLTCIMRQSIITTAVYTYQQFTLGGSVLMTAGSVLTAATSDGSTGGLVSYQAHAHYIAFDA